MIAVDSSVIVAALLRRHENHEAAARALDRALGSADGVVIPAHALIESFSVLTRLPAGYRLAPADALDLLRKNFGSVPLTALPARRVWSVLDHLVDQNLGGGVAYDAVILEAAIDGGAKSLLTSNPRDYEKLRPRLSITAL